MAVEKELNTNFDPILARSDLLEEFGRIFDRPDPNIALAIHEKLGFISLVYGTVTPFMYEGQEHYKDVDVSLVKFTMPATGRPIVRAAISSVGSAVNYELNPSAIDTDRLDINSAVFDRTLAHMCERLQLETEFNEQLLEIFVRQLDILTP